MPELKVIIKGIRADGTHVKTSIMTKADKPHIAIMQVSGIDSKALMWSNRKWAKKKIPPTFMDDVTILSYKVKLKKVKNAKD